MMSRDKKTYAKIHRSQESGDRIVEKLECYNNQLTNLDVSSLNKLDLLYCFDNNMNSVSAVKGFTGIWDFVDFRFSPQKIVPKLTGLSS